jgi:hypothetical protein
MARRREQCTFCGQTQARCRAIARVTGDDHAFISYLPHGAVDIDLTTGELIELPDTHSRVQQVRAGIHRRESA